MRGIRGECFLVSSNSLPHSTAGKRGSAVGVTRTARLQYARELLQKELLPHVGLGEFTETKKAFFIGYMVHRYERKGGWVWSVDMHRGVNCWSSGGDDGANSQGYEGEREAACMDWN